MRHRGIYSHLTFLCNAWAIQKVIMVDVKRDCRTLNFIPYSLLLNNKHPSP